jgi:peptidoglycan/LPS O-acetylase OafA/YrhL
MAVTEHASWPYFVLYLQNWLFISFLNLVPFPIQLGPLWSLAIEEQFYLIWPALIFFLPQRKLVFLSLSVFVFSLVGRLLFVHFWGYATYPPSFLYFNSFTRFDGFAIGALIAMAYQSEPWKRFFSRFAWPVFVIALSGLVTFIFISGNVLPLARDYFLNIWGYSLIVLAAGALLVMATTYSESAFLPRFFRSRVLSFFGKYSYAMYLIHNLIAFILYRQFALKLSRIIPGIQAIQVWLIFVFVALFVTVILSLLTWHLLERHALKLKKYFEYQRVEG